MDGIGVFYLILDNRNTYTLMEAFMKGNGLMMFKMGRVKWTFLMVNIIMDIL